MLASKLSHHKDRDHHTRRRKAVRGYCHLITLGHILCSREVKHFHEQHFLSFHQCPVGKVVGHLGL